MNQLAPLAASSNVPALVAAAGERASLRFLEFFAATIRNPHTRRAYGRAVAEFLAWCDKYGVTSIAAVQPLHVATWIEQQTQTLAAPSVKQRLAAIKRLFDWLVVANRKHPHVGSQSSVGRAHAHCNGPEGSAPESLQLGA